MNRSGQLPTPANAKAPARLAEAPSARRRPNSQLPTRTQQLGLILLFAALIVYVFIRLA